MANTSKNKSDRAATLPDGLALPQEQEIEKAILSGLMASHRHMPTLAAQLLPEMFTLPQVALAFEAYLNIYNRGESADAQSAGDRFHLNPIILLAQAALESGWGTSRLAREANNHFGITGYGASNAFWHGGRVTARYKRGELLFRRYDSARNSYLDFARLLVCSYPQAAAMSRFPADYAKAIAYSPYISELNGDNRERYRETLVQLCHEIEPIYSSLKNNN